MNYVEHIYWLVGVRNPRVDKYTRNLFLAGTGLVTPENLVTLAARCMPLDQTLELLGEYNTREKLEGLIAAMGDKIDPTYESIDLSKIRFRKEFETPLSQISILRKSEGSRYSWVVYPDGGYVQYDYSVVRELVEIGLKKHTARFLKEKTKIGAPSPE